MRSLLVLVVVTALALAGCARGVGSRTAFEPPPPTRPARTATPTTVPQKSADPERAYAALVDGFKLVAPAEIGGEYECDEYSADRLLVQDGMTYTFLVKCLWSSPGKSIEELHQYEVTATMLDNGHLTIDEAHIIIP